MSTEEGRHLEGLDEATERERWEEFHAIPDAAKVTLTPEQEARFWAKVDKSGECWLWTGYVSPAGYGRFGGVKGGRPSQQPHRVAFVLLTGQTIPPGMTLDHKCHTQDVTCPGGPACVHRRCVNPDHLEPVTPRENVLRSSTAPTAVNAAKTHCIRGHPFSGDNLVIDEKGARQCRECRKRRDRERYLRRKAAAK